MSSKFAAQQRKEAAFSPEEFQLPFVFKATLKTRSANC
jgi:hypothetical protein